MKHIKATQPDIFEGVTKESDKLVIVKGIRAEDMTAYDAFTKDWKEKYAASEPSASEAEAEVEEEAPAVPPPKKETALEKLAKLKAAKAAAAPAPAPAAPAPVAKKAVKAAPAAPAVKEAKPVAAKAKAVASKPKVTEEPQMAQMDIDGKTYWHDPDTNGLWEVTGETFAEGSAWMGYFQVDNEEEPIRYTENFGDE